MQEHRASNRYVKNSWLQVFYDRDRHTNETVGMTVLAPDRRCGRQCVRIRGSTEAFSVLEAFLNDGSVGFVEALSDRNVVAKARRQREFCRCLFDRDRILALSR